MISVGLAFTKESLPGATCIVPPQKDLGARGSPWEQNGPRSYWKGDFPSSPPSRCSAEAVVLNSDVYGMWGVEESQTGI